MMHTFLLVLLPFLHITISLHPIVIVPGIGGTQMEAKLNRNSTKHFWCPKDRAWYTIWLAVTELLPFMERCWSDNLKMVYNESSGQMQDVQGVYFRIPGEFGDTESIEWLDPDLHYGPSMYFHALVEMLTSRLGYTRMGDIVAAPYDFRLDPSTATEYYARLKSLIETTSSRNGGKRIMLISHSMGVPYSHIFLRQQTQAWKDKYIAAWTTIAGCFGGAVKAVLAYVSGDSFSIPEILDSPRVLREFQRTFPSLAYMLPDARIWNDTQPLITTSKRSYTAHDYDELFRDMNYPLASKIKRTVPPMWYPEPPGVRMFCFYGTKIQTPAHGGYKKGAFPDGAPIVQFGDGDGTVNYRSMSLCRRWIGMQEKPIEWREFEGAEHRVILTDSRLFESLEEALNKIEKEDEL